MEIDGTGPENDGVLENLMMLILQMGEDERLKLLNQLETALYEEDIDRNRDEPRKNYNKEVSFDFENYTYTGIVTNISTTGAFIETPESFKIGQMIMVNIPDTHDKSPVRLAGEIIRIEPEGIGVKFISKSRT